MKKLLLVCFSLAVLTAVDFAAAADLPVRMPVKAPPAMPPAFSWTGCYLGGYAGGGWNGSDGAVFTDQGQNGLGASGSLGSPRPGLFMSYSGGSVGSQNVPPHSWSDGLGGSFIGGGTLGCNWQPIGSPFVLGLEGEFGGLSLRGQSFDPNTIVNGRTATTIGMSQTVPDVLGSAKVGDWYGMITGRLGYTVWDRTMLYVKGGAAFVPTRASVLDQCQPASGGGAPVVQAGCGNWLISTSGSNTVTTWTIGGGIEWAFAQNWSVKGEYMFIGLSNNNGFQTCGSVTTPGGTTLAGGPFCFNNSFGGIQTVKIGLNYRFY
jgi:outer membrane immunogenic protein